MIKCKYIFERKAIMKLIIAIVNKDDANAVSEALLENGFYSTKLATTGGFLKTGNTTFMVGVDEDKLEDAVSCIKEHSKRRTELMPEMGVQPFEMMPQAVEVSVGGATVFVLDIDRFEKF